MTGFPEHWPESCPPADAEQALGKVYRVCRQDPPALSDFQTHAELNKPSTGNQCIRHGLSVFRNSPEARHITTLFPKLGKLVFCGELNADHGKIKATPTKTRPSHLTWWPFEGVERAATFTLSSEC